MKSFAGIGCPANCSSVQAVTLPASRTCSTSRRRSAARSTSSGSESITSGLTFSLADVEIEMLARFSKGSGRLIVEQVAELPAEVADNDDEPAAGHLPGTLKAEGPWRSYPLDSMFSGSLLKALKKAGIATMGDMADYSASGDKRLIDIAGVGAAKAQQIEDATLAFWRDNEGAK
jgi:hypothetical protein